MPTRSKYRPWLRAWTCFRTWVKQCCVNRPKNVGQERASAAVRGGLIAPGYSPTEVSSNAEGGVDGNAPATRVLPIQSESLRRSLVCESGVSFLKQSDAEQQLDETDLFMRSLLSDMKERHRVVMTLDTAASMHGIMGMSQHEEGKLPGPYEELPVAFDQFEPGEGCPFAAPEASTYRGCSHGPAAHFAAPSEPCKDRFLDDDSGMVLAGMYGVTALSAEAGLSNQARIMHAPAQSSADASPASAFSITPHTPSTKASTFSLISDLSGQGTPPKFAQQFARRYGVVPMGSPGSNWPASGGGEEGLAAPHGTDPGCPSGAAGTVQGPVEAVALVSPAPSNALLSKQPTDKHGAHGPDTTPAETANGAGITGPETARACAAAAAVAVDAEDRGGACGAANAVAADADGGGRGEQPPAPRALRPPKQLPAVVPSLLALLSDFSDLTCLAPPGTLGGVWLGTWRGMNVAVKLTRCGGAWGPCSAALADVARAGGLQHPNLLTVYDVRVVRADEAAMAELDPPPLLRPGWAAGRRPTGRLHRFLAAHPELQAPEPACRGDASLTLYPGDVLLRPPRQLTPGQRALLAVRPRLGDSVVATVMEYCERGNLLTLATSDQSPFRASRFWPAHVAQRSLLRTAREVAAGLAALHAAGIAHGALRPSNVLLSASAADRRGFAARVADVRSLSLSYAASNPLASGPCMVLLAPEALSDEAAEATAPADVYAFGMLLYVMAAGEMPFTGQHLVPVLMAVASEGLRPEWPAEDHPLLEPLFRRCVAQAPEKRPSFRQVLEEIFALEQQLKRERRGSPAR